MPPRTKILALWATTLTTATALEQSEIRFEFERFEDPACSPKYHTSLDEVFTHDMTHWWKDQCHNVRPGEQPFWSFSLEVTENVELLEYSNCTVTAYSEGNCGGVRDTSVDLMSWNNQCVTLERAARSIGFFCDEFTPPVTLEPREARRKIITLVPLPSSTPSNSSTNQTTIGIHPMLKALNSLDVKFAPSTFSREIPYPAFTTRTPEPDFPPPFKNLSELRPDKKERCKHCYFLCVCIGGDRDFMPIQEDKDYGKIQDWSWTDWDWIWR